MDIPLCAVLPDLFAQVEYSLDAKVLADLRKDIRRRIRSDTGALLSSILARPAGVALQVALGRGPGTEATTMFLEWLDRPLSDKQQEVSDRRAQVEVQIKSHQEMRQAVMDEFSETVRRLEIELPSSRLSGRW